MAFLQLLVLKTAIAAPSCPDIGITVDQGWALYQGAELDSAKALIDASIGSLSCQPRVVGRAELLELFQLSALVALSLNDGPSMDLALERALATDHTARPPEGHGPELQGRWDRLAAERASNLVTVEFQAPGFVWVDGRAVSADRPLAIAAGLHVVQIEGPMGTDTQIVPIEQDVVLLGNGDQQISARPPPPTFASTAPVRRRPAALWAAAAGTGGLMVAALASGYRSERSFLGSSYQAEAFGGCAYASACYPQARRDTIAGDAARINAAYGVGYGLAAITSSLITVALIGLPATE